MKILEYAGGYGRVVLPYKFMMKYRIIDIK